MPSTFLYTSLRADSVDAESRAPCRSLITEDFDSSSLAVDGLPALLAHPPANAASMAMLSVSLMLASLRGVATCILDALSAGPGRGAGLQGAWSAVHNTQPPGSRREAARCSAATT
jgi:hypothetical protein